MRARRRRGARRLTAEQVVEIYDLAKVDSADAPLALRNYALRAALEDYGYTPLDAMRARYWLRRGKPADYRWDEAAHRIQRSAHLQRKA